LSFPFRFVVERSRGWIGVLVLGFCLSLGFGFVLQLIGLAIWLIRLWF